MKIFIFTLFLCLNLSAVNAQEADFSAPLQTKASPVVVELFSSENCPACPPAEEYMGELSASKNIIALSCHVDYFGKTSAGLGREFCTDRQTRYIDQIGRKSHFTPQMMVNGHMSEIGYETDKVAASLVKGRSDRVQVIEINPAQEGVYHFTMPENKNVRKVDLWMAVYDKSKMISKRGKPVTYHNVVRRYIPLGNWNGTSFSRAIFPIVDGKSAGFAIVAQERKSGKILAAGDYKI